MSQPFTCWVESNNNKDELTFNDTTNYNRLIPTIRASKQLATGDNPIHLFSDQARTTRLDPETAVDTTLTRIYVSTQAAQPEEPQQKFDYRNALKQKIIPSNNFIATSPSKEPLSSKWNYVNHPQRSEMLTIIKNNGSRKVIKGRRRIGKSTLLKSICRELQEKGTPILFIVCHTDLKEAISALQDSLSSIVFSSNIPLPYNSKSLAQFLNYLIRCGVTVVLDEFQRLTAIPTFFEYLQEEFDQYPTRIGSDMGVFIAMGSHIQDLESIFTSKEPLFQRNFEFNWLKPFTPSTIYSQLKEVIPNLDFGTFLSYYTFGDGIIGTYSSMYSGGYLSGNDPIQSIVSFISKLEIDYSKELRPVCTQVLKIVSDSKPAQLDANITKFLKDNGVDNIAKKFLEDLVNSSFICRLEPIMDLKDTTPKYKIIDFPYRVIQCISNNFHQTKENIRQLEGDVIEDICRSVLPQYLSQLKVGNLIVCNGYWNGSAEIDFFAFDEKNIYLASCKSDPLKQNPINLLSHWVCYLIEKNEQFMINNKDFNSYEYHFIVCSPSFSDDQSKRLKEFPKYYPDFCKYQENLESLIVDQYNSIFHKVIKSFQQFQFSNDQTNNFINNKLENTNNNNNNTKKKDFPKKHPLIKLHSFSLEDFFISHDK